MQQLLKWRHEYSQRATISYYVTEVNDSRFETCHKIYVNPTQAKLARCKYPINRDF